MKAKVKATGEIVNILDYHVYYSGVSFYCKESNGENTWYDSDELVTIQEGTNSINWKQYRLELAKAAMQGILSNEFLLKRLEQTVPEIADKGNMEVIASLSVEYADAVIAKLKE